jgi:hypothetical protein
MFSVAYCSAGILLAISEQHIHAHGSIGSKNIRNTQENTPDASGFDFFSVFLNSKRSVGSEHKFLTRLLVAYAAIAASLWI